MRCWSCGKKIPENAKVCGFCEAPVEPEFSEEEEQIVRELLEQMPPEALEELRTAFADSKSGEDFVNRIMVGACPQCGSHQTGDCENDPEIGELLVGHCYRCGQLWCTECLRLLKPGAVHCPCWDEDVEGEEA